MTTITEAERGKALSEVIRSLSYLDPEGRGDNLAILLCCVFDEHPDCPADEHEGDYGWKPWVAERADAALLMLAGGAIDALLSLGWRPAPVVDDAMAGDPEMTSTHHPGNLIVTAENAEWAATLTSVGGWLDIYADDVSLPALVSVGGLAIRPEAERIANLRRVAAAALATPDALEMGRVHTCETTHCIAGWAVHLSDDPAIKAAEWSAAGTALLGVEAASMFYASNADAREWLRQYLPETSK